LYLQSLTGKITIDTLGGDYPMLAGNVVAIGFSGILCTIISLIKPQNYDWTLMKEIPLVEEDPNAHLNDVSARVPATELLSSVAVWKLVS
jgi:hypothetical protein